VTASRPDPHRVALTLLAALAASLACRAGLPPDPPAADPVNASADIPPYRPPANPYETSAFAGAPPPAAGGHEGHEGHEGHGTMHHGGHEPAGAAPVDHAAHTGGPNHKEPRR
jgi:hypothetical protein